MTKSISNPRYVYGLCFSLVILLAACQNNHPSVRASGCQPGSPQPTQGCRVFTVARGEQVFFGGNDAWAPAPGFLSERFPEDVRLEAARRSLLRTLWQRLPAAWAAANLGMGGVFALAIPLVNGLSHTCLVIPISIWFIMSLWAVTAAGACLALVLLLLYEGWAVKHGNYAWIRLAFGEGEVTTPAARRAWWWILISIGAVIAGVIASNLIRQILPGG